MKIREYKITKGTVLIIVGVVIAILTVIIIITNLNKKKPTPKPIVPPEPVCDEKHEDWNGENCDPVEEPKPGKIYTSELYEHIDTKYTIIKSLIQKEENDKYVRYVYGVDELGEHLIEKGGVFVVDRIEKQIYKVNLDKVNEALKGGKTDDTPKYNYSFYDGKLVIMESLRETTPTEELEPTVEYIVTPDSAIIYSKTYLTTQIDMTEDYIMFLNSKNPATGEDTYGKNLTEITYNWKLLNYGEMIREKVGISKISPLFNQINLKDKLYLFLSTNLETKIYIINEDKLLDKTEDFKDKLENIRTDSTIATDDEHFYNIKIKNNKLVLQQMDEELNIIKSTDLIEINEEAINKAISYGRISIKIKDGIVEMFTELPSNVEKPNEIRTSYYLEYNLKKEKVVKQFSFSNEE